MKSSEHMSSNSKPKFNWYLHYNMEIEDNGMRSAKKKPMTKKEREEKKAQRETSEEVTVTDTREFH